MKQTTRTVVTSAALALVAGGLGAFAYYGVHAPAQKREAQEASDARLLPEDLGEVSRLALERGPERIVLERAASGSWRMREPLDTEADPATVDQMVSRLKEASRQALVAGGAADLSKFGLEAPRLEIVLATPGGEQALRFGRENAFDDTIYVRRGEGPVGLYPRSLWTALDKRTFDLRDKRVLHFDEKTVRRLAVEVDGSSYALSREGEDRWQVSGLANDRADAGAVRTLLSALQGLRAIAFPEEAVQLGPAEAQITVELEDGATSRLVLARAAPGVERLFATGAGLEGVAQVPVDFPGRLRKAPFELRHKKVLDLRREDIARVEVRSPEGAFVLERSAGAGQETWAMVSPRAGAAKQWKVSSLTYALQDLQASAFAVEAVEPATDLSAYGLEAPERTVTAWDPEGRVLGILHVGAQPEGRPETRYLTSGEKARIHEVPETRIAGLPWRLEEVVEPQPGE